MQKNSEMFEQDSLQHTFGRWVFYGTLSIAGLLTLFNFLTLIDEVIHYWTEFEVKIGKENLGNAYDCYLNSLIYIINISTLPFILIRKRDGNPKSGRKVFWKSDLSLKLFLSKFFFYLTIVYSILLFFHTILLVDIIPKIEVNYELQYLYYSLSFFYLLFSWIVVSKTKVDTDV